VNEQRQQPVIAVNTLSVPGARLGGGFTYLRHLLPRLIEAAPESHFHLLVSKSNRKFFAADDVPVSLTTMPDMCLRGAIRTAIDRWWVTGWLRRIEADLYFVPYGWLPKTAPCPTVWTFQNLFLLPGNRHLLPQPRHLIHRLRERGRWWMVEKHLMPATVNADRIIAVSHTAKRDFLAHFPHAEGRVDVVYEGVDERYAPESQEGDDRAVLNRYQLQAPYYLSVSTLMRHKRFYSLIRTFAGFKQQTGAPGILAIAGADWGGYRRDLERAVSKLGAQQFVRFLDYVPPADLPALYRQATAFVLLSTRESFGLPALEAMACGCPTITADIGGMAEVVGNGGIQIGPDDPDQLVHMLTELSKNSDRRAELARAGRARADEFSWSEAARNTVAVFQKALAGSQKVKPMAGDQRQPSVGRQPLTPGLDSPPITTGGSTGITNREKLITRSVR